jgi:hypothetical protein
MLLSRARAWIIFGHRMISPLNDNVGTAMFESRVVTETVSELRGRYRPGSPPLVRLTEKFDSNSVFAHENAHRELSDGSTLGQYMAALAIAEVKSESEETRQRSAVELTEACEQCWFVHEGYATWCQQLYLESTRGDIKSFEAVLLPSYRSAQHGFHTVDREQLERYVKLAGSDVGFDAAQLADDMNLALRSAALVLAGAAMSIPLTSLVNDTIKLPSVPMMCRIRQYCPDLRLLRLAQHMDARFAFKCHEEIRSAAIASRKNGTSKSLDQRLDALMAELGSMAGLEVESVQQGLRVPVVLAKLGVNLDSIVYHDTRVVSNAVARSHIMTVAFTAAEELLQFRPIVLEAAQAAYAKQIMPPLGSQIHIVCELGPRRDNTFATVFIHVYTQDRLNVADRLGKPRLAALIHTNCESETVPSLPARFPSATWNWLIAESARKDWQTKALGRLGTIFATRMNFRDSAPRSLVQEYRIPADPRAVSFSGNSGEQSIVLAILEREVDETDCVFVDLMPAMTTMGPHVLPEPPFELACLGNAVKYGYLRGILSRLLAGADHA